MNYKHTYNNLIQSRSQLNRIKDKDIIGGFENHHIVPKSLGGSNNPENLVLLTPREHYVAHWLLYKIHTGRAKAKMAYAFFKMCQRNSQQMRTITSKQYEIARLTVSQTSRGENHHNYGKTLWTDEQRQKISERQTGQNNSMHGKTPWNKGLTKETNQTLAEMSKKRKGKKFGFQTGYKMNEETKQKISKAHKGKTLKKETKQKLSEINKGKKLSEETKQKMSRARKGRVPAKVKCPHCDKIGNVSAMHRWHFANCKQLFNCNLY